MIGTLMRPADGADGNEKPRSMAGSTFFTRTSENLKNRPTLLLKSHPSKKNQINRASFRTVSARWRATTLTPASSSVSFFPPPPTGIWFSHRRIRAA